MSFMCIDTLYFDNHVWVFKVLDRVKLRWLLEEISAKSYCGWLLTGCVANNNSGRGKYQVHHRGTRLDCLKLATTFMVTYCFYDASLRCFSETDRFYRWSVRMKNFFSWKLHDTVLVIFNVSIYTCLYTVPYIQYRYVNTVYYIYGSVCIYR